MKDRRPKKESKPRSIPPQFRIRDLSSLFTSRYGSALLPDDDSGREDLEIMSHHLAHLSEAERRIRSWASLRAPWLSNGELASMIDHVLENPIRWRADTLARKLNLTASERAARKITTIGAIDETAEQREAKRKIRNRERMEAKRRAKGILPRVRYEPGRKPWELEGISETTWRRRLGKPTWRPTCPP
jgi:hypothetical protein